MSKFIYGLVVGLFIATIIARVFIPQAIVTEHASSLDFDETIESIQNNALLLGWDVPKIYDMQNFLYDEGHEVGKFHIMELADPNQLNTIARSNQMQKFSFLMPFRVSIYENDESEIIISHLNPDLLSNFYGNPAAEILKKISKAKRSLFKNIIKNKI